MKLIHALIGLMALLMLAVPSASNASPHCSAEDRKYAGVWSNYYDPEDAYEFGRAIQKLVENSDLTGLFGLVEGELSIGPRKSFVQNRTFGTVFAQSWRSAVLADKAPCRPVGWRGFMLANGLIWFNVGHKPGTWRVFAINGATVEDYEPAALDLAWSIEGKILPPQCFVKQWLSSDNFEAFEETFRIADIDDFRRNTGRYFGREIDRIDPIDSTWGEGKLSLATFPSECRSGNGQSPDETTTPPIVAREEITNKTCDNHGICLERAYRLLAPVPLAACQNLAPHFSGRCESAYLVQIGDYGGGSMGWDYQFNIYGLFALDDGRQAILPLVNFFNKNEAHNFINEINAGR